MAHSIHSMQLMLNVCDKFAEEFDMRFNGSKSVAMRVVTDTMRIVLHCSLRVMILCMFLN